MAKNVVANIKILRLISFQENRMGRSISKIPHNLYFNLVLQLLQEKLLIQTAFGELTAQNDIYFMTKRSRLNTSMIRY